MQKFYENKNLFITGGSGFLGRVFIEKILRTTDVGCIYFLIRPKKTQTSDERITQIFQETLFDKLRQQKPNAQERVIPIFGDLLSQNFGLSQQDRAMLIANVNIVIHCAATVRFEEPLYNAMIINVRATHEMICLAKEMKQLEAFVHVSSAFANCPKSHVDEKFYPEILSMNADTALKMVELLGPKLTNSLAPSLFNEFPNSYTFTKALAEDLVHKHGDDLPICIFRPAIISSTYEDPIPGWTNNYVGPISVLFPVVNGFVRAVLLKLKYTAQIVPVDYCVNMMIACAWQTANLPCKNSSNTLEKVPESPLIYNFAPNPQNLLTWGQFIEDIHAIVMEFPPSKMIYYPFTIKTPYIYLYRALAFILDDLPTYILDFVAALRGKRPRFRKVYRKYRKAMDVIDYFKIRNWKFEMQNTHKLWASLSAEEKEIFNFDMTSIFWSENSRKIYAGMRLYLSKEKSETIPKAQERVKRLLKIHRTVQGLFFTVLIFSLIWLLRVFLA